MPDDWPIMTVLTLYHYYILAHLLKASKANWDGEGVTPYNGLFGEALPKGVPFPGFRNIRR